jgi:hypothetical protein
MYIIRKELIEKILYNLNYRINTLIIGQFGVGKTSLLKYLESFTPNAFYVSSSGPRQILLQVLKRSGINFKNNELCASLESKAKKIKGLILLIDDADKLSKPAKKVLQELRACLILSSEKALAIDYDILKLGGFNDSELRYYLKGFILDKGTYDKVYHFVKNYSDSSPLSIQRTIELYSKNLNTNQVFSLFKFTSKKIELLTVASFIAIGYLLMSLRYFFYSQKDFMTGYALSITAYLLFFLFRRRK